jgi:hypothetical protein
VDQATPNVFPNMFHHHGQLRFSSNPSSSLLSFYVQLALVHSRQELEAMVGYQGPSTQPFRTCGFVWPAPTLGDIKRYASLLTSTPIHFIIARFIFTSLILYPI